MPGGEAEGNGGLLMVAGYTYLTSSVTSISGGAAAGGAGTASRRSSA